MFFEIEQIYSHMMEIKTSVDMCNNIKKKSIILKCWIYQKYSFV